MGFAYCWLRQLKNFDGFARQQRTVEKGHRIRLLCARRLRFACLTQKDFRLMRIDECCATRLRGFDMSTRLSTKFSTKNRSNSKEFQASNAIVKAGRRRITGIEISLVCMPKPSCWRSTCCETAENQKINAKVSRVPAD